MRSIEYNQRIAREAARNAALQAFADNQEPVCLGSGQFHPPFPIPFIGTLVEQFGLPFREVKTFFVDNSGFGQEGEAALTSERFADLASKLVAEHPRPLYWGVTQTGQFQVYVTAFEKIEQEG